MAPTRRMTAVSLGKIPTTSLLRLISSLSRSRRVRGVELGPVSGGEAMQARTRFRVAFAGTGSVSASSSAGGGPGPRGRRLPPPARAPAALAPSPLELLLEIRRRDGDEPPRPLVERAAAQLRHA